VAELSKPPRAAHARFPFGRPLGEPGNADQQRVMIQDALSVLMDAKEPGTLRALPYRWRREDYAAILKQRRGV
jgi:D-proline reductase (dithiol) PrdB